MVDAIISIVVERVTAIIEEQIRNEVSLVRGAEKEVLNLSHELKRIRSVLDDAESRRFKDKRINDWLVRLERTSYEMEDILDEWDYAILKHKMEDQSNQRVCSFIPSSCLCFKKVAVRHGIAGKIKNVKQQLDLILAEKDRYNFVMSEPANPLPESRRIQSTSLVDLAEVHGRDSERDLLVRELMSDDGSQEELGIDVQSIVGVGGLGKTTLAQMIYNDSRVKEHFELRIWICVSDPFDAAGVAKAIIESVNGGSCPITNQLEMLLQAVKDSVSGKRFLLVLDDVWTEDYKKWEPLNESLRCGGAGSKILVTTRNERVAKMMGTRDSRICRLGQLTDEDCWLLIHRMALSRRNLEEVENFQDIGKKIARKCKGLPLAAKALGSLLRFKNSLEEWNNVLNNEIWQLEEAEVELFPHLLLSYNELSPALKDCFSYCAFFPKDSEINVEDLIEHWMAQGYLGYNIGSVPGDPELRGRQYFDVLAMCSLFQDFTISENGQIFQCKMHDVVHDFAQFLRKDGCNGGVVEAGLMKKTTCQSCTPLLVSHAKGYRSVLVDKEPLPNICDCLASLRVLRITKPNLQGTMPHEIGKLIHLRRLDLSNNDLSVGHLKTICQLYKLQTLLLCSCNLKEIPWQIGSLIQLRHLDLSQNSPLEELPESICDLHELRNLNVNGCHNLCRLPEGISKLTNLKHLHNYCTFSLERIPQGLAQLTGIRTLTEFRGVSGRSKLGLLKNLNQLSGSLFLFVKITDDFEVVEDAQEAELREKSHIQALGIFFQDVMDGNESSVRLDVMDALEPHPNLRSLSILFYNGYKLPSWISSPLNQLRNIRLFRFNLLLSLPPLGELQRLEEIEIDSMFELEFVGREFLGITRTGDMNIESSSGAAAAAAATNNIVAFPKLKKLVFSNCPKWREWEDITAEEEDSAAVSLMPCLTELYIFQCPSLTALPHRLLGRASWLEALKTTGSSQLQQQHHTEKDGSAWKSISRIPGLRL